MRRSIVHSQTNLSSFSSPPLLKLADACLEWGVEWPHGEDDLVIRQMARRPTKQVLLAILEARVRVLQ